MVLVVGRPAIAGEREDNATTAAVDKILAQDVANANFGEAKRKLKSLITQCKKACSGPTLAKVHIALGMIAAQIGQEAEAKQEWFDALNADPNASLPSSGVSAAVKDQFAATQKAWVASNPAPDDASKAGWVNKGAYEFAKAAVAAEVQGDFITCIDKDKEALTLEENLRARLHLAQCESKGGKVVDALRDNAKALEMARAKNDTATVKTIQDRVTELLPRLAHVKFELPTGQNITDVKISFDDRPLPPERYKESFTIDPGKHKTHAEGLLRGARVFFDADTDVADGQTVIVKIKLRPARLTEGQLQCLANATSDEEAEECIKTEKTPIAVHLGVDMSGYTDTLAVHVLTPAVRAQVTSPTAGWTVGASYLVDIVTAASPDLVASASPRFKDVRNAVTANGGYKPGAYGFQLYGDVSSEHDYLSRTIGGAVLGDFADKSITPTVGYSHTWDTVGRTGVSYDVFSHSFLTEEFQLGATAIMSPTAVVVFGGTIALEHGDQSKPYRYVPLFPQGVNPPAGASVDQVNSERLPAKPLEQLPLTRQRFSLGVRYIKRLGSATLRLEERIYDDTWSIKASTSDAKYMIDMSPRLRVWPHAHLHGQTQASFYQRVYGADLAAQQPVPQYRTTDRELSPMVGATLGGGTRIAVTDPTAKFQLAFYATADGLFNYYFSALYIKTRFGLYGTIGAEVDFE
jgi:hypothetical protein